MNANPAPHIELIKNSFGVPDTVFHGLMALGVLKEIAIKSAGANHKRWFAFMRRTGRFAELSEVIAWTQDEFLEYAHLILEMTDPAYPLYAYAHDGVTAITGFSQADIVEYEHLINVGNSINHPPYDVIRI